MSSTKVALVAGGTGLICNLLINFLVSDSRYTKIKCLTRRPLLFQNSRIEEIQTDGENLSELGEHIKADDVFCCLGTTIKKAKSKEAFRQVDFEYPLRLARIAREQGASQYLLVSAMGASAQSSVFYNRVKGELEEEITKIGFSTFHIFRPSLLLGARDEERTAEDAAKMFFKAFGFLVPAKYKPIEAAKVAKAMSQMARREVIGRYVHESRELQQFE